MCFSAPLQRDSDTDQPCMEARRVRLQPSNQNNHLPWWRGGRMYMEDMVTDMKALLVWRVNVFLFALLCYKWSFATRNHQAGNDFHTGIKRWYYECLVFCFLGVFLRFIAYFLFFWILVQMKTSLILYLREEQREILYFGHFCFNKKRNLPTPNFCYRSVAYTPR